MDAQNLHEKLLPVNVMDTGSVDLSNTEIPRDIESEKKDIESRISGQKQSRKDPRAMKEYSFMLNYTDPTGKQWTGQFTNKILSLQERQYVGALRARFAGGLNYESLDDLTAEINLMLAHLEYSLTERPDWAKDLSGMTQLTVVQAIYAEVASHEATFLGYRKSESQSD
jgi:hypothetical protein